MGRRRSTTEPLRFELEPSDEPGLAVPLEPGQPDVDLTSSPALLGRVRAWPRRRVVAACSAVAVALAGAAVASSLQERRRAEALTTAPGGVIDLSNPPARRWSTELESGTPLVAIGDTLVLVEYEGASGAWWGEIDADVRATDATTMLRAVGLENGNEVWSRELDGLWSCGPTPRSVNETVRLSTTESVVCVESADAAGIVVLDGRGDLVGRRTLEPGDELRAPAGGDGILRLRTVGEPGPLPGLVPDSASGWRTDAPINAPDVRLRMEDAVTGQVRWEATVESVPTTQDGLDRCVTWNGDDGSTPEITLDVRSYDAAADDAIVAVSGCGVAASFTPTGTRLDQTGRAGDAPGAEDMPDVGYGLAFGPSVQTTAGGRYVRPHDVDRHGRYSRSPHASWDLLNADGSLVGVLPGAPVDPLASDGAHTDITLTRTGSGNYLSAVRPADATELWSTSDGPRTLGELARTGEVTVVATADNRLTALDLETGRERWAVSLGTDEWSGAHDLHSVVRGAYTDGRVVVVVTPPWGDPDPVWTAYDLATGEVAWTWQPGLGDGIGIAVAGRLVFWDYATLTGLG